MVLEILNKKLCVTHLLDAATIECLADELRIGFRRHLAEEGTGNSGLILFTF